MKEYIIDEQGKWLVQEGARFLIEPSEEYIRQQELNEEERLQEELLNSLKPSEKDILIAEIELNTINLLLELEVI